MGGGYGIGIGSMQISMRAATLRFPRYTGYIPFPFEYDLSHSVESSGGEGANGHVGSKAAAVVNIARIRRRT